MIKFSQYGCGSRLSSGLHNTDWEELLRLSLKEAKLASWDKLSWNVYLDYVDNPSVSVQGTTSTNTWL